MSTKIIFIISTFILITACSSLQRDVLLDKAQKEELLTVERKPIDFGNLMDWNKNKNLCIQIYASYCPISQTSLEELAKMQKELKNIDFIFLSVDHSYHDWKRGLDRLKVVGSHYYIPKKGKGTLAAYLKLKSIPRFIVYNRKGEVELFKTSKVDRLTKVLRKLNNE